MNLEGTVYWITGLSGAGKTTIGSRLYADIRREKDNVVFLDGDVLREVYQDNDYSGEGRRKLAFQHGRLCRMLSEQGIDVVICVIAMFDECREWNRKHIGNYQEIYLYADMKELIRRDQKKLYSRALKKEISNVMGIDISFEEPKAPDIIIDNSGQKTPEEVVEEIERLLNIGKGRPTTDKDIGKKEENDDRAYWNRFYEEGKAKMTPSPFAQDMLPYIQNGMGKRLLDIGCGNGRDSLFFAQNGLSVTGIDQSDSAIRVLNVQYGSSDVEFICGDYAKSDIFEKRTYDFCYCRFFIHAITEWQENILIQKVHKVLIEKGLFFIEVRSVKDELFGRGEPVGRNSFIYDEHYRRFIIREELEKKLHEAGFGIEYSEEKQGFAAFGDLDPCIIRIIAKKEQQGDRV